MLWRGQRESSNVEDRRGISGVAIGGGLGSVVLLVLALLFGVDPRSLINQQPAPTDTYTRQTGQSTSQQDELKQFVSVVLADTEDVWHEQFRNQLNRSYREPKLVLFTRQVNSACGLASSAVGPFYCPEDEKVYIDLAFYQDLKTRFRAPGDFAEAYVIAHEVGHHVQKLLGIMDRVDAVRSRASETQANQLSVRLELQADYFAGVWAHYAQTKGIVEPGDIDEALRAAAAVGDDRLQYQSQGYVVPDSFTHGTSEQRARWFRKGFETGDIRQGDTFSAREL
jgi:predicted metalloprotease